MRSSAPGTCARASPAWPRRAATRQSSNRFMSFSRGYFVGVVRRSPFEGDADHRTVEREVVDGLPGFQLVLEVAPRRGDVTPAKRVAEPGGSLPSQVGVARPDV